MKPPINTRSLTFTVALVLSISAISTVRAESWARFRGPNGTGIATACKMPTTWNADSYAWRVQLPGAGFSSPVVWDDRVYITSGDEKKGTQIIQALDTKTGKPVWQRRFDADAYKKHRLNSYATSTPALDKKHIYITWGGPKGSMIVALDRKRGDEVWRHEMGPFVAMHNFGASPMVVDNLVVVMNDQDKHHMLLALDSSSGDVVWESKEETEAASTYATPCLYQSPDGVCQLIVGRTEAGVMSLNPRTGKKYWSLDLFKFRAVGSPVVADDRIVAICGSGGGGQRAVVIRPGVPEQKVEPKVLYDVEKNLPYVPTPLVHDKRLYLWADSGKVKCVRLDDGKELWQERLRGKFYSSPILVDGKLYCISDKGKMHILAAAPEYKSFGEVDLEEKTMATPAVADGVMYLRTLTHLMALPGGQADTNSHGK